MSLTLERDRYGESSVRVVRLTRRGDRHELKDLTVHIAVQGDLVESQLSGDDRSLLPSDAMKNAVYALAGKHAGGEIEDFALALTHQFVLEHEQLSEATVTIEELRWARIAIGGKPHDRAFSRSGDEKRTTMARRTRAQTVVESGIEELRILKSGRAGFDGYVRDRYTTTDPTPGGILAATLSAHWRYGWTEIPFGLHWQQVREVILSTFAEHGGGSAQHALYAMAQAALEQCPPIAEIRLRLIEHPHALADLSAFGLTNDNEVFVASEEPFGVVEATVRRGEP